ncbi:MAG: carbohydrate porin [Verrucomicrobium sp.]|nr:carbohydrate porin [Verrucomicrobium sp.]
MAVRFPLRRLLPALFLAGTVLRAHAADAPAYSPPIAQPGPSVPGAHVFGNTPSPYAGLPDQPVRGEPSDGLWERPVLLGVPPLRHDMAEEGFSINPVYTGEVFGNVSGGAGGYDGRGRAVMYDHLLNVPLDVDLHRLVPAWQGATFHVNVLWIAGPGLSPAYLGDLGNVSSIQGYNTVRLQELWFQQAFWGERASVRFGQLATDSEFMISDTANLFLNGTFGEFNLAATNLATPYDANNYPIAAPGVRFLVQPIPAFYFMSGLYNGSSESQTLNPYGTDFPVDGHDGLALYSEVGYVVNPDQGLKGSYKLGSFVHTHDWNDWGSREAAALGTGTLRSEGADFGLYAIADHELWKKDGRVLSGFTRLGYAPPDVNIVDWYLDAGLDLTGFMPGRTNDVVGIAMAWSSISRSYGAYQQAVNGTPSYGAETVLEATYKVTITPWWNVQPDFQYIWTPGGQSGAPNAAVIGVRTQIAF